MAIKFSIKLSKYKNGEIKKLEKEIENHEAKLLDQKVQNDHVLLQKKHDLENLYDKKYHEEAIGAEVRSRSKFVSESENNSKFFKNLENKRQINNRITGLLNNDEYLVNKTEDLLDVVTNYYEDLFTSKNVENDEIDRYLQTINIPYKLSKLEAQNCEQIITEEEYLNVIQNNMKNNKSPGYDGIPVEFYQKFWNIIKSPLLDSFQYGINNEELAFSQREVVISLMFKKNDRTRLKKLQAYKFI